MKNLTLIHTTLYAKGWYKKSGELLADLRKVLSMDGYSGDLLKMQDVSHILLTNCQELKIPAFSDLSVFVKGISEEECWKVGYNTKRHILLVGKGEPVEKYDYRTAIIYYCLANLIFIEISQVPNVFPDYSKGMEKPDHITEERLLEFFGEVKVDSI
jgi:hypothetical protein